MADLSKFNVGSEEFDNIPLYVPKEKKTETDQIVGPESVNVTVEMTYRDENAQNSVEVPPRQIHELARSSSVI